MDEFDLEKHSTFKRPPSKKKMKILNENLLSSLHVAKVRDRAASPIMIPTISTADMDPEIYNGSNSSIFRARQQSKRMFNENLSKEFQINSHLTVYRDGKFPEDITEIEIADQFPVFISCSKKKINCLECQK